MAAARIHRRPLPLALALAAALTAPAIAGEVYKWKDANGVTHYSDSPPANRAYESRVINDRGSVATANAPQKPAEDPNCVAARANLERLSGTAQVGIDKDGDGKPDTLLGADERAAQKELAQAAIKVHCAPAAAGTAQK